MKALIIDIPTTPVYATKNFLRLVNRLKPYRLYDQKVKLEDKYSLKFPPPKSYNRGLLYIAAVLEGMSVKVSYYNSDFDKKYWDKCKEEVADSDLLLISAKTNNYPEALKRFNQAKKINKKIITIAGGPHPTALPEECLKEKCLDFIILSEGEETTKQLVKLLNFKKKNYRDILSLGYKENNKIFINKLRPLITDLDSLPMPAYHLLPGGLKSYHPYIDTSRGCVYQCNFCSGPSYWRRAIRTRSFENFYAELELIKSLIGKSNFLHISDPMFGVTPKQMEILDNLTKVKTGLYFSCDVKANYVRGGLIKKMLDANIIIFSLGIESLNELTLNLVNKKCTARAEMKACRIIKKFKNAFLKSYWIIGLPGENKKTLEASNKKIYELLKNNIVDEICSHILVPYPGTEFYNNHKKFGVRLKHKNWERYEGRSYPLVYSLDNLSGKEIYNYFLQSAKSELKYYMEKYPQLTESRGDNNLKTISFSKYKGRLI
jgi:anaerobic magnesium-protoporphyrin IX monomethyl ester cyclase